MVALPGAHRAQVSPWVEFDTVEERQHIQENKNGHSKQIPTQQVALGACGDVILVIIFVIILII